MDFLSTVAAPGWLIHIAWYSEAEMMEKPDLGPDGLCGSKTGYKADVANTIAGDGFLGRSWLRP